MKRVQDAIDLKEPDSLPLILRVSGAPYHLYEDIGASHASAMYDYDKAAQAFIKYHEEFQPDVRSVPTVSQSGKGNEFAGSTMLDWPGRPGTPVDDLSTYQVIEHEFMDQDEYDELISDYTGFVFRKFIPRAYTELKAFECFNVYPAFMMGVGTFAQMINADVKAMLQKFTNMIDAQMKHIEAEAVLDKKLDDMGFPPFMTGMGSVPYDIISDHFRGTMGIFEDLLAVPDKIAQANEVFADLQMKHWEYFKNKPMPVKRVFFPLHKGMDGFMNPTQYHELYWEPYHKMLKYLIDMGVTPEIYTEGPYNSRVDYIRERLTEFPPGSCIIHFEQGDFAELKKKFSGLACLIGGIPIPLLEFGTKQQVIDRVKYLIDNCAAGGGYLISGNATFEKVKRENFEAMFDTIRTYGKK